MRRGAIILLMLACAASGCTQEPQWHDGTPLRGVISLSGSRPGGPLLCGYNYDLISRWAAHTGREASLRLSQGRDAVLDSLRKGSIDIAAFPWDEKLELDSGLVAFRTDSCGLWVFSVSRTTEALKASEWMETFHRSGRGREERRPYFEVQHRGGRDSAAFISPYDSLFRAWSDTLHWDWRLLAALVYQESKFHIEAVSGAGAAGLMQLLPETARLYGCTNPLDPAQSIRAGVLLLLDLQERYEGIAASAADLTKFTLAAYNAGSGRIRDCIGHARHLGIDVSSWENVAAVIPQMSEDSIAALDHIRHGTFNGRETIAFVRQIAAGFERYKHICPQE